MAWISFRVPNVCEALKTQKNPRHVPCPLKSNRTAVGLTRPPIFLEKWLLRRWMDARAFASPKRLQPRRRVKPAHDEFRIKGSHARFHASPGNSGDRSVNRGRHHRVLDVPLRGRSGEPDGGAGYLAGTARLNPRLVG